MKGTIKDALVSLQVLAISQADDELQELAESGIKKLAALTAERDALKEALTDLYNACQKDGLWEHIPAYIVRNARDLLEAK